MARKRGPEVTRRAILYTVAASVGVAAAYPEVADRDDGIALPVGGPAEETPTPELTDTGDTGDGGSSVSSAGDIQIDVAGTLGAIPEADTYPRIAWVTGNNRERGAYVEYDNTLPIGSRIAEGSDQFEILIANALGDIGTPDTEHAFIFITGESREAGVYVYGDSAGFDISDAGEWYIRDDLSGVPAAENIPQMSFIVGDNRTRGVYVDG